jgi:hypothetical protein
MEKHLDIVSLINSDFYKKSQRLSWHISHEKYNKLAGDLLNLLKNLKLYKNEDEIFQIVRSDIYISLSQYLSHVYDYVLLSKKNIKIIYSDASNIYINPIWQKKNIDKIWLLDLEKNRDNTSIIRNFYFKLTKHMPKSFFKFVAVSQNELSSEFKKNIQYQYLKIQPKYYFPVNLKKNKFSRNLSEKISQLIFLMINENYFDLNSDHKQSINTIIETYLARAINDVQVYDGFLKKTKNIITGTGHSYYTKLLSNLAKKSGSKIWRFNHGGERCFFDDEFFWDNEFLYTDIYVTYGIKWGEYLKRKAKKYNKNIEIKTIGSRYHKKIFDLYFGKKTNNPKKILYIPHSFVSEGRQFPNTKIIDPVLYDWQKYLLETLKKLKFEAIYKMHPKGFCQNINNLGNFAKHKTTKPMIESLQDADTVIFDYAGSAFVEAICAGKDVIYIDMKQRLYDKDNFNEFNSFVKIVSTYVQDGIFYLNVDELRNALNSPHKNIKNQEKIVNDYFLKLTD